MVGDIVVEQSLKYKKYMWFYSICGLMAHEINICLIQGEKIQQASSKNDCPRRDC